MAASNRPNTKDPRKSSGLSAGMAWATGMVVLNVLFWGSIYGAMRALLPGRPPLEIAVIWYLLGIATQLLWPMLHSRTMDQRAWREFFTGLPLVAVLGPLGGLFLLAVPG